MPQDDKSRPAHEELRIRIIDSDAALRRAAKRALQSGLETGTPVYVLEDGKIVDLTKRYRHEGKRRER